MRMKTASVQQLPEQWPQILRWVAAGEEVAVTSRKKTVAKIVPVPDEANGKEEGSVVKKRKAAWAEHFKRLDAIYEGKPARGKPASEIIIEGRR